MCAAITSQLAPVTRQWVNLGKWSGQNLSSKKLHLSLVIHTDKCLTVQLIYLQCYCEEEANVTVPESETVMASILISLNSKNSTILLLIVFNLQVRNYWLSKQAGEFTGYKCYQTLYEMHLELSNALIF